MSAERKYWCLGSFMIEQSCGMEPGVSENVELSCDRDEHAEGELHFDRKRALWWQEDSEHTAASHQPTREDPDGGSQ